ncbi:MAG: GAF domain-containing protein [Burkholderiales bacterium]|nr:GAF domain-containing protein [Burkholderiales bacterium]
MEMFIHQDDLQVFQAQLEQPARPLAEQLPLQVEMVWHMRQRDTRYALKLSDSIEARLASAEAQASIPEATRRQLAARILLVRGEAKWLFAELDAAFELAQQAFAIFTELMDEIGCADSHWLMAWIENDRGDYAAHDEEMVNMAQAALAGGDTLRVDLAQASLAVSAAFRDPQAAEEHWDRHFHADMENLHPALYACVNDFLSRLASQTSDFGRAITYRLRTRESALQTGQIGRAIYAMINASSDFSCLNEHNTALDWTQRALDLARPTGWPSRIGACLVQSAETLRQLGRLNAAHELVSEALQTMAPLAGSRTYALALRCMGELALDRGDNRAALAWFGQLQQRASVLAQAELEITALRGQADAWLRLNKAQPAISAALISLALARQNSDAHKQIAALQVLADIHARQPALETNAITQGSASLHYLRQALDIADSIEGYTVPGNLLDAVAQAHSASGDFQTAFAVVRQANAAREKIHSQQATNRAIAMQVRHETERAQAEGEYHRQLAETEARRAQVLQQTSTTLAHLSAIGQEITAHLDAAAVFRALDRHVHGLIEVNYFAIYMMDFDAQGLTSALRIEGGRTLPEHKVPLTHPHSYCARCVRERREFLIELEGHEAQKTISPGANPTLSMLFGPLMVDGRVIGVMTVQALPAKAYAEQEQLIFRTLCAYGAIALDNANTYHQLQQAQEQLVAQEKLAALGALVAGVAHELNSPIGNSLTIASVLQEQTDAMQMAMQAQNLHFSQLERFLDDTHEASVLILRGLESAADLVNSFKQVAVDRTTAQRREFDLAQTTHEIVATMMSQIRPAGHHIVLEIPEKIKLQSYPGPFGQVITNFINNALKHAFTEGVEGEMRIKASQPVAGRVQIQFIDNGVGISEENVKRIFDPFFTTKLGQGGSGLGLNISFNIITSLLKGHIRVHSTVGVGTTFVLDLPLVVEDDLLQEAHASVREGG